MEELIKTFEIKGHPVRLSKDVPARLLLEVMNPYASKEHRDKVQSDLFFKMIVDLEDFHDDIKIPDLIAFMTSDDFKNFLSEQSQQN